MKNLQDYKKLMNLLATDNSSIWVFTGDSITHGCKHVNGRRNYVEHFQERVRWELGHFNDFIINTGISGNKTVDLLNSFDARITRFNPAVVAIMIGTNDCSAGESGRSFYHANLIKIVNNIRNIDAIPVLQTPNPIYYAEAESRVDLPNYVQIIREIAKAKGVILIDHYEYWEEKKPDQKELYATWLNDPIHPNQYGHLEMAKKIFLDLQIYD